MLAPLKRLVVGRPIATYQAGHHRFGILGGLAVLSSDALSWGAGGGAKVRRRGVMGGGAPTSTATEEVLRVLMIGGLATMSS